MGLAHWYLQARLNQLHDFSIILDQSRYIALITTRFLPNSDITDPSEEDTKKYKAPLPYSFVATTKDKSPNYYAVQELETKYGFQYSSGVGMLIFLLNTAIVLHFAIRKLAKFNSLPGETHYKSLIHLLHHLRTHRTQFGTKFYSPDADPPIYARIREIYPDFDFSLYPILLFTNSSWQDCPDTSRSTGCYCTYVHGSLVDSASFVPSPIAMSSAEAEYNAAAFGLTAALHTKQVYNFFMQRHPDSPVTIALFTDSASAICMMNNNKDTKRTRHIERRIHFLRHARQQGLFVPFKIAGELNPADLGTKNLTDTVIQSHMPMIHIPVNP